MRNSELRRRGRRGSLVRFEPQLSRVRVRSQVGEGQQESAFNGWDLVIDKQSSKTAQELGSSCTDSECVVAGLRAVLSDLGRQDIVIPESAASHLGKWFSYRLPDEAWAALHSLGSDEHEAVVMAMATMLHAGRIRKHATHRPKVGRGHLLLPLELSGEERFTHEALSLMRMLPCLGLDRGMEQPSEYGIMFAYENEEAKDSLEFAPLLECYRKSRSSFVQGLGISSEADFVGFIEAYGRSCKLLGEEASAAFQDIDFARDTARQVILRGPGRVISEW